LANIKSSKKRILIGERNRLRNVRFKSKLKSIIKTTHTSIESKDKNSVDLVNKTVKFIDTIARKGVIHRNKAARLKSQLSKKV
jgi:small subunit ribosomal protein S20